MSWQDEQRRLDEELSAGRLSAGDYRRRREELASRRLGGDGDAPESRPATPFPPAFRWETTPHDDSAEATQLFTPVAADETQVVTSWPDDTERTQVVSPQQRPDARDAVTPSPSSPFPVPPGGSRWMAGGNGPVDSDRTAAASSRVGTIAATVVVLLLVVGGGLGAYWSWWSPQPDQRPAVQQQPRADAAQPPAQRREAQPVPGSELPDPAEIGGDGATRVLPTLGELRAAQVLAPEEYAVLADAAASSSKLIVSSYEDGPRATLLIIRLGSPEQAAAARDELVEVQQGAGLQPAPSPAPGMRSFYVVDDPTIGPTVRGVYHNGDLLVRLEVVGSEPVPTARRYDLIVEQQLATLPADD